jgi:hypothetical protein
VKTLINKYLVEMETGRVEEVVVRGPARPPGLLKALLGRYGEELETLQADCQLHDVHIDIHR